MSRHSDETIDQLVSKNLEAAKVLSKYGIDLCSGRNRLVSEACREVNVSLTKVLGQIRQLERSRQTRSLDANTLEIDRLTVFIEKYYHHFTHENIAFIKANAERLVRLYATKYPEVKEINRLFQEMAAELTVHMEHEEFIVFPYIRQIVKRRRKVKTAIYRHVDSPVASMLHDHEGQWVRLKKLSNLTHDYSVPENGCAFFGVTYGALREFAEDLREHMRLENEVLFPKALEMEATFGADLYSKN